MTRVIAIAGLAAALAAGGCSLAADSSTDHLRRCLTDSDCPTGERCGTEGYCFGGGGADSSTTDAQDTATDACMATACAEGDSCCSCGDDVCSSSETCCGGVCINPLVHDDHCGGCGIPCEGDNVCRNAVCICQTAGAPCAADLTCCRGSCADLASDEHCGSCDQMCTGMRSCDAATRTCQ